MTSKSIRKTLVTFWEKLTENLIRKKSLSNTKNSLLLVYSVLNSRILSGYYDIIKS